MDTPRRIVVIGASAGGIEALRELVRGLPAEFPAPIAVVLHTSPQAPGVLHDILDRSGPLAGTDPGNGDRLRAGHIYVAPPDHHLLIEPGRIRLSRGPKENRFRPAIDPLFRTAAQVYGPAAIGVILTGNLDDGTAGLWAIKQLGGTAVVQDPADALFPSMPLSAARHVSVDYCVPLREMPALLTGLAARPLAAPDAAQPPAGRDERMEVEIRIAKEENPVSPEFERHAHPSPFACPECHGVLHSLKEAGRIRFRCHTGHAYSLESLLAEVHEGIETALWSAVRALQEGGLLVQEVSQHLGGQHADHTGASLAARARHLRESAAAVRAILTATPALVESEP